MGSFGERLQREREMRGITLEEIAEATKIGTRSLRALEAEEFDKLPGGVFNKGFVRAYSRYLGIDEEQAVADYLAALAEAQTAARAQAEEGGQEVIGSLEESPSSSGSGLTVVVALLLIAGLGFGGWKYYARRKSAAPPQAVMQAKTEAKKPQPAQATAAAAETSAPAASAPIKKPEPAASSSTSTEPVKRAAAAAIETAKAAISSEQGFTVAIRATEDAWVSITADGKTVLEEILHPATEKTLHAQQQLAIRTGNAGALEISFNGRQLGAVGSSKQVRTLTFTPEGLQTP